MGFCCWIKTILVPPTERPFFQKTRPFPSFNMAMVGIYHHGQEHLPGPALQRGHQSFVMLAFTSLISDIIPFEKDMSFNYSSSFSAASSTSWASPIMHQQFQHTLCTGSRISSRLHLSQLPCNSSIRVSPFHEGPTPCKRVGA